MIKLCECGCGNPAPIAKQTKASHGHIKGQPVRFIQGHNCPKGEKHPRWRGGIRHGGGSNNSHVRILQRDHPKNDGGYVKDYILKAELALGKYLPDNACVHHHSNCQLVICQDNAYHKLIHQRMRAFYACGNANWRKCKFCKQYDEPINLIISNKPRSSIYHRKCELHNQKLKRIRRKHDPTTYHRVKGQNHHHHGDA